LATAWAEESKTAADGFMMVFASIFSDFNLPNATTWLYFSLLLSIALYFKFTRLLSMRNWDVITLFLLAPGLLLLQDTSPQIASAARLVAAGGQAAAMPGIGVPFLSLLASANGPPLLTPSRVHWFGYLWLLCGSVYLLVRCLIDLTLVRRPALSPNLNLSGLVWLGAALFVCLCTVAVRRPASPPGPVGRPSAVVDETQRRAEDLVKQELVVARVKEVNATFWVPCISAMVCHLAIIIGLTFIGWRHFQDVHTGVAAAAFYLLLPYTAYHVDQVHHVLPAALVLWAVAAYRLPLLAGLLLGVAFGAGYFPILLLPAWSSFYWRRGTWRFLGGFALAAGLCLAILAFILWIDDNLGLSIQSALSLSDWQPWKQPSFETRGFWTAVHWAWAYRLPVFSAYLAFVAVTTFWPAPKNLAHLLALSAALIIGIQLWYGDQGGVYVLWYLPIFLLLVFRPNLSDREAVPLSAGKDWMLRLGRHFIRLEKRLPGPPEYTARPH
jgi:hypothetical protein